jgi:hypothetical protein
MLFSLTVNTSPYHKGWHWESYTEENNMKSNFPESFLPVTHDVNLKEFPDILNFWVVMI